MNKYNICKHGLQKKFTEMRNPRKSKACTMWITQMLLTIINPLFILKKGGKLKTQYNLQSYTLTRANTSAQDNLSKMSRPSELLAQFFLELTQERTQQSLLGLSHGTP